MQSQSLSSIKYEGQKQKGFSNHLIVIRPNLFYCNQETIADNMYQTNTKSLTSQQINSKAINQFDSLVQKLKANKIKVTIVQDPGFNKTPDSIFPNNWISFHHKNRAIIYSMCAQNRRLQKQIPLLQVLKKQLGLVIEILYDYSQFQKNNLFLQGTGSLVLDRQNKIAYACLSQRTNKRLVDKFCKDMEYKQFTFTASQYCQDRKIRVPIYHTNVLMTISKKFVLICFQLVHGQQDQQMLRQIIQRTGKQIIELTADQIKCFAANALTVQNQDGQLYLIMSEEGYKSLQKNQIQIIEKSTKIITSEIRTIQKNGGGSVRCMLTEVF